jgi:hypothetical protein
MRQEIVGTVEAREAKQESSPRDYLGLFTLQNE